MRTPTKAVTNKMGRRRMQKIFLFKIQLSLRVWPVTSANEMITRAALRICKCAGRIVEERCDHAPVEMNAARFTSIRACPSITSVER